MIFVAERLYRANLNELVVTRVDSFEIFLKNEIQLLSSQTKNNT